VKSDEETHELMLGDPSQFDSRRQEWSARAAVIPAMMRRLWVSEWWTGEAVTTEMSSYCSYCYHQQHSVHFDLTPDTAKALVSNSCMAEFSALVHSSDFSSHFSRRVLEQALSDVNSFGTNVALKFGNQQPVHFPSSSNLVLVHCVEKTVAKQITPIH